jgi:hypothetical protein
MSSIVFLLDVLTWMMMMMMGRLLFCIGVAELTGWLLKLDQDDASEKADGDGGDRDPWF